MTSVDTPNGSNRQTLPVYNDPHCSCGYPELVRSAFCREEEASSGLYAILRNMQTIMQIVLESSLCDPKLDTVTFFPQFCAVVEARNRLMQKCGLPTPTILQQEKPSEEIRRLVGERFHSLTPYGYYVVCAMAMKPEDLPSPNFQQNS